MVGNGGHIQSDCLKSCFFDFSLWKKAAGLWATAGLDLRRPHTISQTHYSSGPMRRDCEGVTRILCLSWS